MKRWRVMLTAGLLFSACALSLSAGNLVMCRSNCTNQYSATLRYCTTVLAKDSSKGAWYVDCVKNAQKFRDGCNRSCR